MADLRSGYRTSGWVGSAVLSALHCPIAGALFHRMTELRYTGNRTGRAFSVPVRYARRGNEIVVRVGRPDAKTWWRNFTTHSPLSLWIDHRWRSGVGRVLMPGSRAYGYAAAIYRRPPSSELPTDPLVLIKLAPGSDDGTAPAMRRGKRLWRRWLLAVTIGEVLGFLFPSVTAVVAGPVDEPIAAATLVAAGTIEGGVLGWFQASALHGALPRLDKHRWILATAFGAAMAWTVALVMIMADGFKRWPTAAAVPTLAAGVVVIVCSIGITQWFVLRDHLVGADGWIGATALAWIVGLSVFTAVTSPLWQPGQPIWLVVAIGLAGGCLMAAAMAGVTGSFLVWLLRAQPHNRCPAAQPGDRSAQALLVRSRRSRPA
ncbi:hypothetical protein [Nocardia cyriacigeorgica]|uniref:hypothetical protein n=2 Tax=Nocardia cyriacigeorgica TaxID=135487 RepID=UPI00110A061F|nr:hypothetical protein [Nocardia cyriacigeorgica]TLF54507.1 hypothetical protein FEK31_23825 [Nocardia cyriacigeorgica]BDU05935.1 hypothetical protein FMUBM48_21980 [Nocardia cyriacigeorgica]